MKQGKRAGRKTRYDFKRKKHVQLKPQQGFLAAAAVSCAKLVKKLVNALKFEKRCHEKYLANDFGEERYKKKRFRESGAGRRANHQLLKKQCLNGSSMFEDLLRDVYQRKCFVQSVNKFILIG